MKVIRESYKYAKKYTHIWVSVILLGVLSIVCYVLLPQAPQLIIDRIVSPALGGEAVVNENNILSPLLNGLASDDYLGMFLRIAVACLGIALIRYLCHYIRWNLAHGAGVKTEKAMRMAVFSKLIEQNPIVLERYTSGDLISIANSDPVTIKDFYALHLPILIDQVLVVLLAVYFLSTINPLLLIVPLVMTVFTVIISVLYIKSLRKRYEKIRECSANLASVVQENIGGVRIIRSYASENIEKEKFEKRNDAYRGAYVNHAKTWAGYQVLFNMSGQIINLASIIIGVVLATSGQMSLGTFTTFLSYVGMINPPMIAITQYLGLIQNSMICGNRMFGFLYMDNGIKDMPNALEIEGSPDIKLKNVSVRLNRDEEIRNFSVDIPAGKKLGVMGKTGAGKSVFVKCLPRFFETANGEISINGRSIREYKVDSVRRQFSYVMQDVFLFSDTVDNNISFFDLDADFSKVQRAAVAAQADSFIERLPEGYNTVVGERGLGLSGGQKQRISIARAILKDAPVFLFDDCTSALDLETEQEILNGLDKDYPDKTIIITSHRASSVRHCDEILFLEDGEIVERGTHEQLMEEKGKYFEVFSSQEASAKEALL